MYLLLTLATYWIRFFTVFIKHIPFLGILQCTKDESIAVAMYFYTSFLSVYVSLFLYVGLLIKALFLLYKKHSSDLTQP